MKIRLAKKELEIDSIVDGEGIRAVLWTQGCRHNCPGCHNPETHCFDKGYLVEIEDIKKQIDLLEGHTGLTLSGGDPLEQIEECLEIAKYCKLKELNIWCYTGYTFEYLLEKSKKDKKLSELLNNIDVLVDGPFVLSKKSYDVIFRGSTNQRLIDVPKSLALNKVCLKEIEKRKKERKTCLYV